MEGCELCHCLLGRSELQQHALSHCPPALLHMHVLIGAQQQCCCIQEHYTATTTVLLGAPTHRWMFIQQTHMFTPSTQWCEIPVQEGSLAKSPTFNFLVLTLHTEAMTDEVVFPPLGHVDSAWLRPRCFLLNLNAKLCLDISLIHAIKMSDIDMESKTQ